MRKPIVRSSRQLLFFAESSALCFPNKDVPENITVHSLSFHSIIFAPLRRHKGTQIHTHIHTLDYHMLTSLSN